MRISILGSIWQSWHDFISGIFAIIPQSMYFLYTCCASLLDFFQFIVRKLVGFDVYYVDNVAKSGDLLSEIINNILGINTTGYSALRTVFWSLVVFGLILIIITTIISVIKTHFNYDAKKSQPMAIVFSSIKSAFMIAIVPILTVFGLYISNVILKVLDEITSPNATTSIAEVYEGSSNSFTETFQEGLNSRGESTYASFDLFGNVAYSDSLSFSGVLFKLCAGDCNRVRYGSYTAELAGSAWSDFGIFNGGDSESVALKIDTAFANCLTLKNPESAQMFMAESWPLISTYSYLGSTTFSIGLKEVKCFSKFNVGLVWYYYNLWAFNLLLGMIGIATMDVLLFSVCFGLVKRLIQGVALFMVYPPLVGISPLDNSKVMGKWNKEFISNALMGISAIVGLNLCFLVLPYFQSIKFFTSDILNELMDLAIIIVALMGTKKIVELISGMIGSKNANSEGEPLKKDVKTAGVAGGSTFVKAAKVGVDMALLATGVGSVAVAGKKAAQKAVIKKMEKEAQKKAMKKAEEKASGLSNKVQKGMTQKEELNKDVPFMSEDEARSEYDNTVEKISDLRDEIHGAEDINDFRKNLREYSINKEGSRIAFNSKQKALMDRYDASKEFDEINKALISGNITGQEAEDQRKVIYEQLIDDYAKDNNYAQLSDAEIKDKEDNINVLRNRLNRLDDQIVKQKRVRKKQDSKGALLNITNTSLKVFGDISGLKGIWEQLKSTGSAGENLKESTQKFYQMIGALDVTARAQAGEGKLALKTRATEVKKEKAEKKDLALKNEMLSQSKKMLSQIEELKRKNSL